MDKVILVNKEKGYTSRDVVNIISKHYKIKKVGHFGTLDPLACGLLIVGVGVLTKLDNFDIFNEKEYVATVLVGTSTTTYDITGDIIREEVFNLDKNYLEEVLLGFNKTYLQEVPIYSAVKVNGKKLYSYARNKEKVELPKKEVTISNMKLLDVYNNDNKTYFKFSCTVSKGTYIRSLINDISKELGIPLCMSGLVRTRQGKFSLDNASKIDDIVLDKASLLDIAQVIDLKKMILSDDLYKYVINGNKIDDLGYDYVLFTDLFDNNIALYKKDKNMMKPCFFFKKD